jgi:hypothetical protein
LEQQKPLRLYRLSAIWNERTLEEYDGRYLLEGKRAEGRHVMLKAMFTGKCCVLKQVPL